MHTGHDARLEELERLLNDPDVPMRAGRVWELIAEISDPTLCGEHACSAAQRERAGGAHPVDPGDFSPSTIAICLT